MAPPNKQSEGIALLSMYSDEDDDEMDEGEGEQQLQPESGENESREETKLEEEGDGAEGSGSPSNFEGDFISRAILEDSEDNMRVDSENQVSGDTKSLGVEGAGNASEENANPLDKFLPPRPPEMCSEDLQRKINKFLALKKIGRSFNAEVRNRKDYRNPDFLLHAVRYQDIDQIGSCLSKDVFDPHGYDSHDFYDEIEADMKRERERKEQESKRNQKIEFTPGATQAGIFSASAKPNIPELQALASGGVQSLSSSTDVVNRDGRPNKKSKWDKVDGDGKSHPAPASQEVTLPSVRAQALLSATNVGSGYTGFVQQKRKEEEERKSSERKLDRKS